MSQHRISPDAGWVNKKRLPKGENGRALCRRCQVEVPKGRRSFCSDACVDQHRITTDPGYVRLLLFRRDKGICAVCGVDTEQQRRIARGMDWHPRQAYLESIKAQGRITFWDADHIVSVVEGGGECGIENFATLCCKCHKAKTAQLARDRAAARKAAKLADKENRDVE